MTSICPAKKLIDGASFGVPGKTRHFANLVTWFLDETGFVVSGPILQADPEQVVSCPRKVVRT
jgi:hypothetical protein